MLKLIQIFDERPFPLLFFSYIVYFFLHFTNSPFSPYIRGKLSAKQKISFIYTTGIPVGPTQDDEYFGQVVGRTLRCTWYYQIPSKGTTQKTNKKYQFITPKLIPNHQQYSTFNYQNQKDTQHFASCKYHQPLSYYHS